MTPYGYYQGGVEQEVFGASGIQLVVLLYRGAIEAVNSARSALQEGDIPARSQAISKAIAIVNELASSLDHSAAADLSSSLAQLYDYIARLLIKANVEQQDAPLAEAANLLGTLAEGWAAASEIPDPAAMQASVYGSATASFSTCG